MKFSVLYFDVCKLIMIYNKINFVIMNEIYKCLNEFIVLVNLMIKFWEGKNKR